MDTQEHIKLQIEDVRSKLMDLVENTGEFNSEQVLEVSEYLDVLINDYFRSK